MKKLTLLMATLMLAMFSHAGEVIFYYTASTSVIGSYTVKANMKTQGSEVADADATWETATMTLTELTYNSDPVYQAKITTPWGGFSTLQFQLWDGETWKSQVVAFDGSEWIGDATINGKMYVHSTSSWVAAPEGAELPQLTYYIKNNWNGGEWAWQKMTKTTDDTYTYEGVFGGGGCNINTSESDGGAKWFPVSDITVTGGSLIAGATALFTYTVSTEALAAEITAAGEEKKIEDGSDLYLIGNIEGYDWDPSNTPKMTLADGKYSITAKLVNSNTEEEYAYFSFLTQLASASDAWDEISAYRFGAETDGTIVEMGVAAKLVSGTNAFKVIKGVTYTITVDPAAMTVSATTEEDIPQGDASDYYLVGFIGGADYGCGEDWANLGSYKFVDGKLTVTFTTGDADYGKNYVFVKTGDNKKWYMAAEYSETSPATLALSEDGVEGTPAEKVGIAELGTYEFTLTENTDGTITLAFAKTETPDIPVTPDTKLYVMGAVRGTNYTWAANLGEEMTYADGNYTLTTHIANDGTGEIGYFCFTTKLAEGNEEADWNAIASYRYGVATEDEEAVTGTATPLVSATNGYKIAAGTYTLTVNLSDKTYLITAATPVEDIKSMNLRIADGTIYAEGNLSIFTLTGQDVTAQNGNLSGLYIVTIDGKAQKVLVR